MGSPCRPTLLLLCLHLVVAACLLLSPAAAAPQPFRRDPGHPHWHHGAFHDVQDTVRADVRRMLHSRAEVPFQVPLEVNIVLVEFNGDGGYRYTLDAHKLEGFLKAGFPTHQPSCFETGEPIDIEHHIVYNVIPAGQPELIAIEKALKEAMTPAGTARESEYGREFPLFEAEATSVEPIFQRLYSYIFDVESGGYSATEMNRPASTAIFITNFDKVRMDPRNKEIDLDNLMFGELKGLTEEELKKQEGGYIYQYRYNGGGASQVWLSAGRFVVIDILAGPCVYGKIETEEGSVSYRTLPRLSNLIFPGGSLVPRVASTYDIFMGQLGGLHSVEDHASSLVCVQSSASVAKAEQVGKSEQVQGRKVTLLDLTGEEVGRGIVMSDEKEKSMMGMMLSGVFYEVVVFFAIKPEAPLFVKDADRKITGDAVGSHIA